MLPLVTATLDLGLLGKDIASETAYAVPLALSSYISDRYFL
jgi:hypothetical protein